MVEAATTTYEGGSAALATAPSEVLIQGHYELSFVRHPQQLDEILRLRFEVFNLEMGEGLEESFATGLDRDAFDDVCHHLRVVDRRSRAVIGTYRLQTSTMAASLISSAPLYLRIIP